MRYPGAWPVTLILCKIKRRTLATNTLAFSARDACLNRKSFFLLRWAFKNMDLRSAQRLPHRFPELTSIRIAKKLGRSLKKWSPETDDLEQVAGRVRSNECLLRLRLARLQKNKKKLNWRICDHGVAPQDVVPDANSQSELG